MTTKEPKKERIEFFATPPSVDRSCPGPQVMICGEKPTTPEGEKALADLVQAIVESEFEAANAQ